MSRWRKRWGGRYKRLRVREPISPEVLREKATGEAATVEQHWRMRFHGNPLR